MGMMSRINGVALGVLLLVGASLASAQFKTQRDAEGRVSDGVSTESPSLFMGWFDPEKFHMSHSFSMSYMTGGGQGLSLGTYTNSMTYRFSDKIDARADLSMMYSPYNTLGSFNGAGKGKNDFSSIFLSRAEVNYHPWENVRFKLEFRQSPFYNPYYSPYYSPWFGDFGF
jgi:hypothetical protein